jgi:glycosyltransferase involved in cell wall biosynthesis
MLLMHTDPRDPNGQDLYVLIERLGLTKDKKVVLSTEKVPPNVLALMYNVSKCTINCSNAEGFGLSACESLACETPIIVNMTGGLQEQVTSIKDMSCEMMLKRNHKNKVVTYECGVGIEPASKTVIGSQEVPYIYEDCLSKDGFVKALKVMYYMDESKRRRLGSAARQHVMNNYNFDNYKSRWVKILEELYEKNGSWNNRKNYSSWELLEV